MANFFDRFDQPATPVAPSPQQQSAQSGGNFFDQFDVPIPEPKPDMRGPLQKAWDFQHGLQRNIVQGMTFGLSDEAAGAGSAVGEFLKSVLTGKPLFDRPNLTSQITGEVERGAFSRAGQAFSRARAEERDAAVAFRDENPVLGYGGELLGGFAGMAPKVALNAGRMIPQLAGQGAQPMTVGQMAAQSGKVGATTGAIAGFGSAEGDIGDRLEGAGLGAVTGGTLGAAVPPLANLAGRATGRVVDALGLRNAERAAQRQLLRAFERDVAGGGPGIGEVQARVAANLDSATARPEMLPDIAGENVKNLARAATQMPSTARQQAQAALTARVEAQPDRIADDVARLVSPNQDFHGTVTQLAEARRAAAQPAYDAAFARNAWSPRVDAFVNDPIGKQGLAKGLEILRIEGVAQGRPVDWKQLGVVFNEAGDPQLVAKPNMRLLDAVKRGVDDLLEPYRDKVTGRLVLDQRGQALDSFRRAFLGEMDSLNPAYAQARQAWAGPSAMRDALEMGRGIFGRDAEISTATVARLSPSEKEMFAAGAARAIADRVDSTADGRNVVASFFNKPGFRDKLRAAFPDDVSFQQFTSLMQRENQMAEAARIYGPRTGSQTVRTGADQADMMIDPPAGVIGNLLAGRPGRATAAAAEGVMRRAQGMNSSTADALAPLLFETEPQKMARVLRELSVARQEATQDMARRRALARALMAGGGIETGNLTDYGR